MVAALPPGHAAQEDWLRSGTWDLTTLDGTFVDDLASLASALGTDVEEAARAVLSEPFGRCAPERLLAQARYAVRERGEGPAETPAGPSPYGGF